MIFLHQNIHKYTWTSHDGKTHNQIDHVLIKKIPTCLLCFLRSFYVFLPDISSWKQTGILKCKWLVMFLMLQSLPINHKYSDTAILSTFRIHQKSPHVFPLSTDHSSNIRERWWGITGCRSSVKPTYAEQEL